MCPQMIIWCKSVWERRKSFCYGCNVHSHTRTFTPSLSEGLLTGAHGRAHTVSNLVGNEDKIQCWQLHQHNPHVWEEIKLTATAALVCYQPCLLLQIQIVCVRACVHLRVHSHLLLRRRIFQINVMVPFKFWPVIKMIIHTPKPGS